jgi:hypothetical protein
MEELSGNPLRFTFKIYPETTCSSSSLHCYHPGLTSLFSHLNDGSLRDTVLSPLRFLVNIAARIILLKHQVWSYPSSAQIFPQGNGQGLYMTYRALLPHQIFHHISDFTTCPFFLLSVLHRNTSGPPLPQGCSLCLRCLFPVYLLGQLSTSKSLLQSHLLSMTHPNNPVVVRTLCPCSHIPDLPSPAMYFLLSPVLNTMFYYF